MLRGGGWRQGRREAMRSDTHICRSHVSDRPTSAATPWGLLVPQPVQASSANDQVHPTVLVDVQLHPEADTCDGVEKARRDIWSYIALHTGTATDPVAPATSVVPENPPIMAPKT